MHRLSCSTSFSLLLVLSTKDSYKPHITIIIIHRCTNISIYKLLSNPIIPLELDRYPMRYEEQWLSWLIYVFQRREMKFNHFQGFAEGYTDSTLWNQDPNLIPLTIYSTGRSKWNLFYYILLPPKGLERKGKNRTRYTHWISEVAVHFVHGMHSWSCRPPIRCFL